MNSRVCQKVHADSGIFTDYYISADRAKLLESLQLLTEAAAGGSISQAPCTRAASTAIVTATVLVSPGQAHYLSVQWPTSSSSRKYFARC